MSDDLNAKVLERIEKQRAKEPVTPPPAPKPSTSEARYAEINAQVEQYKKGGAA